MSDLLGAVFMIGTVVGCIIGAVATIVIGRWLR